MKKFSDVAECLLDGNRGINLPSEFAKYYSEGNLTPEQISDLSDPSNECYWETWEDVLDMTVKIDGKEYTLYQDSDLFILPVGEEIDFDN